MSANPPDWAESDGCAVPRRVLTSKAATVIARNVAVSMSSGIRAPNAPVSTPARAGAAMPATVVAACDKPTARVRFSRPGNGGQEGLPGGAGERLPGRQRGHERERRRPERW